MGKKTVLLKSEEKRDIKSVAAFLRELADKIESQKVVLKQGSKETKLKIPNTVELEVKAEREDGKNKSKKKLEVEIEWVVGAKDDGSVSLG
ncbi:MAG: amphi-Trp domain-containing protein [Desulfocapsaceae bacterium]|nr:amphi-Trp domain-containing protein [Desulfocapsaceae bacterium]